MKNIEDQLVAHLEYAESLANKERKEGEAVAWRKRWFELVRALIRDEIAKAKPQ